MKEQHHTTEYVEHGTQVLLQNTLKNMLFATDAQIYTDFFFALIFSIKGEYFSVCFL